MHTHLLVLRPRVAQAARSRGLSAFGRSLSEEGQKGIRQLPVFSERHAHTPTRLISMNHSEFLRRTGSAVLGCVVFPREFDPTWFRRECCRTPIEPSRCYVIQECIPLQSSKCGELLPQARLNHTSTFAVLVHWPRRVRPFRPVWSMGPVTATKNYCMLE